MADMKAIMQQTSMQEQYDEDAKWLISQKPFLANILTRTVEEFKDMKPEEVEKLIEGEPSVGRTPVEEGFTNEKQEDGTITISGMNTEKKVVNEGVTYFDILFYVRTKSRLAKIIINIELQKDEPTLYDIEMRGIFYACREVSSQLDREFNKQHYNEIKKVYSIWICMNSDANSLNKIGLNNENILGRSSWKEYYDIVNVLTIRLGDRLDEDKTHELHRLLGAIFGQDLSFLEKEKILEEEFGIELESNGKERLDSMCNLGEGIWERGLKQGEERGILGIIEICKQLNLSENDIIEKLREIMHISDEEAKRYYKQTM